MLIEFRVKNFRSIKDEQTLSMVASSDSSLSENTFSVNEQDGRRAINKLHFLKSVVVYGANASGKSNLFKAMHTLFFLMSETGPQSLEESFRGDNPWFMLSKDCIHKPSEFTLVFTIGDDIQYEFYLAFIGKCVVEERLDYYPRGRTSTLYHRKLLSHETMKYDWFFPGGNLKGDKVGLRDKTTEKSLFLRVAAAFNQPQLRPLVLWFESQIVMSDAFGFSLNIRVMQYENHLTNNPNSRDNVKRWLVAADLGIQDFQIDSREQKRLIRMKSGEIQKHTRMVPGFSFIHSSKEGTSAHIQLEEESTGTQRWFELYFQLSRVLKNGGVLLIDEISAELHPLLVEYFFNVIHNPQMNPKNAQLVCTTHHSSLLGAKILRRDQIWFAEKDGEGASHYYSLLEFRPRKDEALMKGYLSGSYGAIPDLADIRELIG